MMVKEGRADAHVEPNLFPVCNIRFDFDHVKWDAQSVERPHGKDGEGSERREQVLLFPKKKKFVGKVGFLFKKELFTWLIGTPSPSFAFPFSWSRTLTCA